MFTLLAQAADFSDWATTPELTTTTADLSGASSLMAWLLPMIGVLSVIGLALYIYTALALMAIAKKTNTPNGWMAFVPIANLILVWQISKTPSWALIIVLCSILAAIPILGTIIGLAAFAVFIWMWWKICERLSYPGWWSIMQLIAPVWLVMIGIMAWGKKGAVTA